MTADSFVRGLRFIAIVLIFTGIGCASRGPTSAMLHVREQSPATMSISSGALADMTIGEQRFNLAIGDRESAVIVIRREPTTLHGAAMAVHEGDRRVEYLTRLENGSIALTAAADLAENALTLFSPPLVIAPPMLDPGQTHESSAMMRVMALDDPSRQRERGRATRRMTAVADAVVDLSGRAISAVRIDIEFHADLRFADARERTTMIVSPMDGLLSIQSEETVTILGAFPRSSTHALWRTE